MRHHEDDDDQKELNWLESLLATEPEDLEDQSIDYGELYRSQLDG